MQLTRTLITIGIIASLGGCAGTAPTIPLQPEQGPVTSSVNKLVHEMTLANGMQVIVKEDHRAPVAVSQVWYKVGSSTEHNGVTGVSHVLEHMMFKGTRKLGPNEFSKIIAANGGRENAFTGPDYTAYFQTMEKSRMPLSFELEADRMQNLILNEEEFKKEVQVVMEERRMRTEDNPRALTYEQFGAAAYVNNPHRSPVIGWMDDLKNMQAEDLAEWYRKWYTPNNAILVVVGDVEPAFIFAQAKKHFGKIKPRPVPAKKPQVEIKQLGEKRIKVKAPAKVPYLLMGYKVPSIINAEQNWEPYALEVMAWVLDGGNSSRFSRELIREQQIAVGVGTGYDAFSPHQELFLFSGTPSANKTVTDLEEAIRKQIQKIQNSPVTSAELKRVKAQVIAGKVYEKDSIFYQAMSIGMMETINMEWELSEQFADNIKKVTAEQIQQVAKKYFSDDVLTVAVLEPQKIEMSKGGNK